MTKHEILDPDRPGRRSGIRRLMYRPAGDNSNGAHGSGSSRWQDSREWSAIKDQLRLTVRRAPEVVINVRGSRRANDNDERAIQGVLRYMMYISRNGQLPLPNEHGEQVEGIGAVREAHASWDLDMQRMRGAKSEALHPSFNIIFSMPADTDSATILDAVSAVARERFSGHQYVMTVHTPQTDPADNPPAHPHVHLVLRAEDENGLRMHIRKGTLRLWREQFAKELRARGIEANATSRAERGKSIKSKGSAEWHIQKRYEENVRQGKRATPSRARAARILEAAHELTDAPVRERPWEIAMAARRRDVLRELNTNMERLRQEGEDALANEVQQFISEMPPLDSERHKIQRALVKQVQDRLHEVTKERDFGK